MKIPALLTLLLAAVLSALPVSPARADEDVSFDVFYNSLGEQGDWYNTKEYGYVWQPSIAYQNDKWRPYSDGYWAQTDDGWTWVSYENFGWATYHYGRWTNLEDTGWVWVPGYEWGPGWVAWRTNDDYVGWAPLPPKRESSRHGGGASLTVDYNTVESEEGYDSGVDEQYDIGPSNYCFVETRYFAAPVLREVILPPQRNIVIIENTINVTNIHYRRGGPGVVVYNQGPDFDFLSRRVDRPIQRLRIERRDDLGFLRNGDSRDRNPNVVRDGVFQIAAPNITHRPVDFNVVKPPTIKRDIRDPRVEHGWRNTGADQPTVERVRQQFQTQARERPTRPPGLPNATTTPPADPRQRNRERDPRAAVPPTPGVNPVTDATPPVNPRQRGRDGRTNVLPTPAVSPAVPSPLPRGNSDADKRARRDAAQREKEARANGVQPTPPIAPGVTPAERPSAPPRNPPGQPFTEPSRDRKAPDAIQEPTAAPTAPRDVKPARDPRRNNPRQPATNPDEAPAATPREERRNQPTAEPKATAPARPTEDAVRPPRQRERLQPEAAPTRNTAPENAPERRPARPQEPPAAPRQEVREQPQPRQQPPAAPRQEVREQPRQQAPPRQEAPAAPRQEARPQPQTQPQPNGDPDDKKKRPN